ncbi:MAG: hypothetical protein ACRCTX_07400 [Afipia sp.]
MSYTTIKAVWPGEKAEDLEELRNSHGSAPVIWGALCERYLGGRNEWLFGGNALWPLYKRADIPKCMRAVLMMTYDRAYVERKDYAQAAADIEEFMRIAPPPANYVNYWPRIAAIFKSDPDIPAIGFCCTSVSEDLFQGEWNDEKEDYDPPDWSRFWSVYDNEALSANQPTKGEDQNESH